MHFFTLLVLLGAVTCTPLRKRNSFCANDLVTIESTTASCAGAPLAAECRTAAQAAPWISASFATFGITDYYTQAALISLMVYESGGFKYSQNHFPGVPGQGTRNMQSPAYNLKYAQYLATLPSSNITAADVATAQAKGPAAVLALVNTDKWSFASAAWYLTQECNPSISQGLAEGTQVGWSNYLTCVGTPATNDRTQIWDKATALGRWNA